MTSEPRARVKKRMFTNNGKLRIENEVLASLRKISRSVDIHSRFLLQQYGLTLPQLATLRAVGGLQPVTISEVAKHIHLSPATINGIFNRLEQRNLISRHRSGKDRRAVMVSLTESGTETLRSAPSLLQEQFIDSLHRLEDWERTQILSVLQRIANMMDGKANEKTKKFEKSPSDPLG